MRIWSGKKDNWTKNPAAIDHRLKKLMGQAVLKAHICHCVRQMDLLLKNGRYGNREQPDDCSLFFS